MPTASASAPASASATAIPTATAAAEATTATPTMLPPPEGTFNTREQLPGLGQWAFHASIV
ncbi:uncharacterized protein N7515_001207 [Penicillium bovifimosum]|uniref:Uncharacterized protein n=1 Tax=Penicillium bovifimosum TaxID=126998 RepID=A0A9W9HFU5_9EURO|nr:uncharacterized protein N7515_000684 [Penicillium bovifimosum]XP_056527117.1 uncharacterized protein N7515_001207 [Penicillium bovifimosum]KAJ5146120.1 hypothetical protein N7515_000684 [Penicillium bovifimosum]KAJ5146643.1 hypothetical protein N7515_001207 [Penicillium bovifimosum]